MAREGVPGMARGGVPGMSRLGEGPQGASLLQEHPLHIPLGLQLPPCQGPGRHQPGARYGSWASRQ